MLNILILLTGKGEKKIKRKLKGRVVGGGKVSMIISANVQWHIDLRVYDSAIISAP